MRIYVTPKHIIENRLFTKDRKYASRLTPVGFWAEKGKIQQLRLQRKDDMICIKDAQKIDNRLLTILRLTELPKKSSEKYKDLGKILAKKEE